MKPDLTWIKFKEFGVIYNRVAEVLEEHDIRCMCGKKLTEKELKMSESHGEYWIYTHCNRCSYDLNYNKIFKQGEAKSQ